MGSPLDVLVGTWRGIGEGHFPTMEPFAYDEEIRFEEIGAPPLIYTQRSWSRDVGEALHLESGIWRATEDGAVAITVALPRVTEVSEGRLEDGVLETRSTTVARAAGGAPLVAVRRRYEIRGDVIAYDVWMATERVGDLTHHLSGTLRRSA